MFMTQNQPGNKPDPKQQIRPDAARNFRRHSPALPPLAASKASRFCRVLLLRQNATSHQRFADAIVQGDSAYQCRHVTLVQRLRSLLVSVFCNGRTAPAFF